jgi:prepilin-type N-terminal cleavage/methylation domain-containing protein
MKTKLLVTSKQISNIKKSQKGFSLVELLIVVTILGILAAISVPNLIASRRAANEASAIATCRALYSAQISYFTVNNQYCDTLGVLGASGFLGGTVVGGTSNGYMFELKQVTAPTPLPFSTAYAFHAHAKVSSGGLATGTRGFYMDSTSSLIYSTITKAGPGMFPADATAPSDPAFTPVK